MGPSERPWGMIRRRFLCPFAASVVAWAAVGMDLGSARAATAVGKESLTAGAPVARVGVRANVVVIPIHGEIGQPTLYLLRRGLKAAISDHADAVVLDIDTPGGALDATLTMLEALGRFPGRTIAYVDSEAMSAGAFVSAGCGEIWFAPGAVIGAAAPVLESGQDVDSTMKQKLTSYLKARMRALSEDKPRRGEVIAAMIDADSELTVDGKVIKPKGQLLSLTASEAMHAYGTPPQPLLGAGEAPSLDLLLDRCFGEGNHSLVRVEPTWSERLAAGINGAAPLLMGLGLLALFVGFKSPGLGALIPVGVGMLTIVFFGGQSAGLSGHEPILIFGFGVVLLLLEIVFFHSAGFLGIAGFLMMLASLIWSMADLWPNEPLSAAWNGNAFVDPFLRLSMALVGSAVAFALLLRFLPSGWIWNRLAVRSTVGGTSQPPPAAASAVVGKAATALTTLAPSGYVLVEGLRYEAFCESGMAERGAALRVVGVDNFRIIVTNN